MFALLIPTLLSCLMLAAHFFRGDNLPPIPLLSPVLVFLSLAAPTLLLVRRRWATALLQFVLLLGALEWVRALLAIKAEREEIGEPWQRMAIILGAVAAFTALSALVYFLPPLRRHYSPREDPSTAPA